LFGSELAPEGMLPPPIESLGNGLQLAQVDEVAAMHRPGQEQNFFLDVGGQVEQLCGQIGYVALR
jgi:hypothetical protein